MSRQKTSKMFAQVSVSIPNAAGRVSTAAWSLLCNTPMFCLPLKQADRLSRTDEHELLAMLQCLVQDPLAFDKASAAAAASEQLLAR